MRSSFRLLAAVQRNGSHFLEPGAPTGLTGLQTSASPRRSLIFLYNRTLEKLKEFPEHSVYRQSTEALTRHRLRIVESVKPEGLNEWQSRFQQTADKSPAIFKKIPTQGSNGSEFNIVWKTKEVVDEDGNARHVPVADGEEVHDIGLHFGEAGQRRADGPSEMEQSRKTPEQRQQDLIKRIEEGPHLSAASSAGSEGNAESSSKASQSQPGTDPDFALSERLVEPEPPLTADQVGEVESKINAGLIEEVIQVAEAEQELVDVMLKTKIWEDLEEKPVEGQWTYNERDRHTAGTGTGQ